ncbi:MAG: hypothetical protein R3A45_03915 [Bdellovibrionota bacterium]
MVPRIHNATTVKEVSLSMPVEVFSGQEQFFRNLRVIFTENPENPAYRSAYQKGKKTRPVGSLTELS